jgi:hypothetical protein
MPSWRSESILGALQIDSLSQIHFPFRTRHEISFYPIADPKSNPLFVRGADEGVPRATHTVNLAGYLKRRSGVRLMMLTGE